MPRPQNHHPHPYPEPEYHPYHTTTWGYTRGGGHEGDGDEDQVLGYDVSQIGVPISITLLVLLVMCMGIAYAKARKKHIASMRRAAGEPDRPANISGGVPMNANAYRNYAFSSNQPPRDLPPAYDEAVHLTQMDPTAPPPEMILPPTYDSIAPAASSAPVNLTSGQDSHPQQGQRSEDKYKQVGAGVDTCAAGVSSQQVLPKPNDTPPSGTPAQRASLGGESDSSVSSSGQQAGTLAAAGTSDPNRTCTTGGGDRVTISGTAASSLEESAQVRYQRSPPDGAEQGADATATDRIGRHGEENNQESHIAY